MERNVELLTDREHILIRPNMWIGSIRPINEIRYVIENNKFVEKEITYIPGLVKIFEEILDNSVDELIHLLDKKPKIEIQLHRDWFSIEDNGRGIPNKKIYNSRKGKEEYECVVAWNEAKAGSNFKDDRKGAGANGVGSFATNVFSKKFIGINRNSGKKIIFESFDNASKYKIIESKTKKTGVKVIVYPDFERFDIKEFSDNELIVIETRIKMLVLTYPEIKFVLNNNILKSSEIEF